MWYIASMKTLFAALVTMALIGCNPPAEVIETSTMENPPLINNQKSLPPGFDIDRLCTVTCNGQGFGFGRWCACAGYQTNVCVCTYESMACEQVPGYSCEAP